MIFYIIHKLLKFEKKNFLLPTGNFLKLTFKDINFDDDFQYLCYSKKA